MKAIILAGGLGTRLRGTVSDLPKPMAPVAGKPFLEYLILQLTKAGIRDIILSVGYKREAVISYFSDGKIWGARIEYAEEMEPLGTGGGVRQALSHIEGENFLVMNGDSYLDVDLGELIRFHRIRGAVLTMALAKCDDASRYGKVEIDEQGEVVRFVEKGAKGAGLVNGGVYAVNKVLRGYLPEGKSSLEHDVFPRFVGAGLYGMAADGFFIDIGIPEDYEFAVRNYRKLL